MRRREFAVALGLAGLAADVSAQTVRKGRLKQCVTAGVFGRGVAFEDQYRMAAEVGCVGFDLVQTRDWPTLKKYGLIPTMSSPQLSDTFPMASTRKRTTSGWKKGYGRQSISALQRGVPI